MKIGRNTQKINKYIYMYIENYIKICKYMKIYRKLNKKIKIY